MDKEIQILEDFDIEDYDVVNELIPIFFNESFEEYNREFHFGITWREDPTFCFLIAERIFYFLLDNGWDANLDLIQELVEEHYGIV